MRTAVAVSESHTLKIARFGDNMRNVAVTEGDKVEAQIKLGWTVDGYGVGDLVERIEAVSEQDILIDLWMNMRKSIRLYQKASKMVR